MIPYYAGKSEDDASTTATTSTEDARISDNDVGTDVKNGAKMNNKSCVYPILFQKCIIMVLLKTKIIP